MGDTVRISWLMCVKTIRGWHEVLTKPHTSTLISSRQTYIMSSFNTDFIFEPTWLTLALIHNRFQLLITVNVLKVTIVQALGRYFLRHEYSGYLYWELHKIFCLCWFRDPCWGNACWGKLNYMICFCAVKYLYYLKCHEPDAVSSHRICNSLKAIFF